MPRLCLRYSAATDRKALQGEINKLQAENARLRKHHTEIIDGLCDQLNEAESDLEKINADLENITKLEKPTTEHGCTTYGKELVKKMQDLNDTLAKIHSEHPHTNKSLQEQSRRNQLRRRTQVDTMLETSGSGYGNLQEYLQLEFIVNMDAFTEWLDTSRWTNWLEEHDRKFASRFVFSPAAGG